MSRCEIGCVLWLLLTGLAVLLTWIFMRTKDVETGLEPKSGVVRAAARRKANPAPSSDKNLAYSTLNYPTPIPKRPFHSFIVSWPLHGLLMGKMTIKY
jgi:hypothetical protein